jgi:hypothetical protein
MLVSLFTFLDAGLMWQYIQFCVDHLVVALQQSYVPLDDIHLPPRKNKLLALAYP